MGDNMSKYANVAEWLDDMEPRTFYTSDVLNDLQDFGFTVKQHIADGNDKWNYYDIRYGDDSHRITVNTWEDDFAAMVMRGLPFFVIDEDHHGEPESHVKNGTGYAVISPDQADMNQLAMLGAGYIYKNEEALRQTTVVGESIFRAVARLVAKKSPGDEFHGRGFAARANLKAVKEALGLVES